MKKEELWDILKTRNPQFVTGPIQFSPQALRRFFDLVWDKAAEGKTVKDKPPLEPPDFFKMFGATPQQQQ